MPEHAGLFKCTGTTVLTIRLLLIMHDPVASIYEVSESILHSFPCTPLPGKTSLKPVLETGKGKTETATDS